MRLYTGRNDGECSTILKGTHYGCPSRYSVPVWMPSGATRLMNNSVVISVTKVVTVVNKRTPLRPSCSQSVRIGWGLRLDSAAAR